MTTRLYEKGTIKVVWLEDEADKIYSKMFDRVNEADEFTKDKRDYLIFSLIKHKNMEEFSWELLPFGKHKLYKILFRVYRWWKSYSLSKQ